MHAIILGFSTLFDPTVIFFLLIGIIAGLIIGSIPRLNENIAFAVFLPFSFAMSSSNALSLMIGVYCATAVGGAIPAIMLKVPGTASSVLTAIDGNAMAKRGHSSKAIGIAISSSVFGGLSSSIVLLFFAPILAQFALRFGYVENFALCFLGLASVVGMMDKNIIKGLFSAIFGLLIATVGLSLDSGFARFTFHNTNLYDGAPFVSIMVGLFGITAALELTEEVFTSKKNKTKLEETPKLRGSLLPSKTMIKRLLPTWCYCSTIGNIVGVLPGAGMIMAIYLAYNQAASRFKRKFLGKKGEYSWGDGTPEGIAAPESANNAVVASSMVPLLSLGIPGNSVSALFIGALMIHGMAPGPLLFLSHANIAWMIICAFFIANIVMGPIAIIIVRYVSGLVYNIPKTILIPCITLLCLSGAYADGNSMFNIYFTIISGVFGYIMNKFDIPTAPLILALVLGKQVEGSLSNSLNISNGNWAIFFNFHSHPISAVLMCAGVFFILLPIYKELKFLINNKRQSVSTANL